MFGSFLGREMCCAARVPLELDGASIGDQVDVFFSRTRPRNSYKLPEMIFPLVLAREKFRNSYL
jgi:hypothetical protein